MKSGKRKRDEAKRMMLMIAAAERDLRGNES
jgi:hypothetical protein